MKISISYSFIGYILLISLLSNPEAAVGLVLALAVHELAHYAVISCIHEPVRRVNITPFGGVMQYQAGFSASKGIRGMILSAAGPIGNYAMILLLNALPKGYLSVWIREAMICNLSMMIINMIPVLPLDGGAFLFSMAYYLFDLPLLIRILTAMGMVLGAVMCILSVYGWIQLRVLNLSLLIVGVYLIYAARQSNEDMLHQNQYAIIREKMACTRKVKKGTLYTVSADTRILDLLQCIARSGAACFLLQPDGSDPLILSEEQIYAEILSEPTAKAGDVVKNRKKCAEALKH